MALVVDVSGTEAKFVETHKQTVLRFLDNILSDRDRALLISVGIQQRLVTDLTGSLKTLRDGVEAITDMTGEVLGEPCSNWRVRVLWTSVVGPCSSPIWNAVLYAADLKLRPQPGRKAILLLSDGWDMGSQHRLPDAIAASQNAETAVYSIQYFDLMTELPPGLPERVFRALQSKRHRRLLEREAKRCKRNLERLADETGGALYLGDSGNLTGIFDRIEADLRDQYVIGYIQSDAPKRGYHRIRVRVNRPGLVVRARAGYNVQ